MSQEITTQLTSLLARYGVQLEQPIRTEADALKVAEIAMEWAKAKGGAV